MKTGYANGILIRLALSSINDGHKIFDINHAAGHHLPFDYDALGKFMKIMPAPTRNEGQLLSIFVLWNV